MTPSSIGPGAVLGGRYRLDDLLTDHDGARFWRATDTVLARSVAVHAVASDDPRAGRLLEAARRSAMVTDPHLLRVLDCDTSTVAGSGEVTWVVNEWGSGVSLDLMLDQGALPASRAAWLAREVAEAIAAAHAVGVPHGMLSPESVLVTEAGAVKLIGFVVNAALADPPPVDPLYGKVDDREADVINLAGILYAALTGRWPGVARSGVPQAPREGRRPLRPRQVRAGIPRTLDAICDRVLNKEASQHSLPIETAHEIAAALSDFVGDPAAAAPLDVPSMYAEPTITLIRDAVTGLPMLPESETRASAGRESPTDDIPAVEAPVPVRAPDPDPDPEATQIALPQLEETQAHRLDQDRPSQRPDVSPALPPFEQPADRPLFASAEPRPDFIDHNATHRKPVEPDPITQTGAGNGSGFWPFEEEPEKSNFRGDEGRNWLRLAAIVGVIVAIAAAMTLAFNMGRSGDESSTDGPNSPGGTATSGGALLKIEAVKDFDPEGTPPEENPSRVGLAIDGDSKTSWSTLTYRGNAKLGGLKSGVGLIVDLGKVVRAGSIEVSFVGSPTAATIYAAASGAGSMPDSLGDQRLVAENNAAGTRTLFRFKAKVATRYLTIWMTSLPSADGGFKGAIAEVSVRS